MNFVNRSNLSSSSLDICLPSGLLGSGLYPFISSLNASFSFLSSSVKFSTSSFFFHSGIGPVEFSASYSLVVNFSHRSHSFNSSLVGSLPSRLSRSYSSFIISYSISFLNASIYSYVGFSVFSFENAIMFRHSICLISILS